MSMQLPESVKVIKKEGNRATFEIGPLMPGYGPTIANPLRRVLLSSLEGSAVTSVKISGIDHEFTAIPNILEDVIQVVLSLKQLRFKSYSPEPIIVKLEAKGEKAVTGADIILHSDVELINPGQHICTITNKKGAIDMELTIQRGRGYLSTEQREKEKLPIGVIAIDAIFSPVRLVNFSIDDVRVGDRIDFHRITMEIETDGSVQPEFAIQEASRILKEHFDLISQIRVPEAEEKPEKSEKKPKRVSKKVVEDVDKE